MTGGRAAQHRQRPPPRVGLPGAQRQGSAERAERGTPRELPAQGSPDPESLWEGPPGFRCRCRCRCRDLTASKKLPLFSAAQVRARSTRPAVAFQHFVNPEGATLRVIPGQKNPDGGKTRPAWGASPLLCTPAGHRRTGPSQTGPGPPRRAPGPPRPTRGQGGGAAPARARPRGEFAGPAPAGRQGAEPPAGQ